MIHLLHFYHPSWFYEELKGSANILLSRCQPPDLAVLKIPPAVGLVDVKLWGLVLGSATSLIPAPCSCLCCASHPQPWHSCAKNLSAPQTHESGASPQPLVEGPQAESVFPSLDSSTSRAGRAAKGTRRKTVRVPLSLIREDYAHLSVPSLGH